MKRKTLAILLSALLVVSALFVLVACAATEYTITFRDYTGKALATKTTEGGKVTYDKTPTRDGYNFDGWYIPASETDYYGEKVDLATKVFKADTELYAKWERIITAGEDAGYVAIGGINNWNVEDLTTYKLTQSTTEINKYSITLELTAQAEFKIKTAVACWDNGAAWDAAKGVNAGADAVAEVTKADAVTASDAKALFDLPSGGNIKALCAMNVTVTLVYAGPDSTINLHVNSTSGPVPSPIDQVGYGIMGTFAGKAYTEEDGETALTVNSLTSKDLKLTANANKTQYKLENLELKQGDEFVIRVNEAIAGLAKYDRSALKRVDLATGVTRPAEANENIELFMASESNIMARCDMTVDVTLYTIGGMQIGIVVKELDASEGLKKDALKIELVGKIGGQDSWNGGPDFAANSDLTKYTVTNIALKAGDQIKVRSKGTWSGPVNAGGWNINSVTLGTGVTLADVDDYKAYFFAETDFEKNENIQVAKACTVTIEYVDGDPSARKLNIIITAIPAE